MTINLFQAKAPDYHLKSDIYDPDHPEAPGRVVPRVNALILDNSPEGGNAIYTVDSVDPVTYKVTYAPARVLLVDPVDNGMASVVSYGNDVFRVFYDARTNPTKLSLDGRLVLYGATLANYRLTRHPGTPQAEVISRHYDADGLYTSPLVPMARIQANAGGYIGQLLGRQFGIQSGNGGEANAWYATGCHTLASLSDGETLLLEVFNEHGSLAATATLVTKQSTILNEAPGGAPVITNFTIHCAQTRAGGDFYVFEKQDPQSLSITARLHYDDGRVVETPIDGVKTILYGLEDFIPSFAGLAQKVMVKYYLGIDEVVSPELTTERHLSAEATLVVVPNELAAGVKLSVIPVWNQGLGRYALRYHYYTTDRDVSKDVTAHVQVVEGSFTGNLYGVAQSLTLEADMAAIAPSQYDAAVVHRQTVVIKLQPVAAVERYTLRDAASSPYVYGVDASTQRRPLLGYDPARQQYYVPSAVFANQAAFLKSFYETATPPYVVGAEDRPPVPTHFLLRDAASGTMVVPSPIPVADYALAFNVVGSPANRFVGNTVVVEFLRRVDADTDMILYGVPVDVYERPGYIGP